MTKRKPTKHEDDIRRNLRKSAEINPAQSPHDGIHTCSKGCKKPGCNRGLRDTIEEQNAQIEALKQDLLEQTAAVCHLRMERVHDLNHIGGLQEENSNLKADIKDLREDRIRMCDVTIEDIAVIARLKAEVERLDTLCKQLGKQHSDISCENIMLRKAGDEVIHEWSSGYEKEARNFMKALVIWNAAKEGKPSV